MANKVFKRATLHVYFQTGVDENGKPIKKRQTLQNVSVNATADVLDRVAMAIASLYNGTLLEIEVVQNEAIQ